MNDKPESTLSIIAAFLALFTAIIAPPISAMLAVLLPAASTIYKSWHRRQTKNKTQVTV